MKKESCNFHIPRVSFLAAHCAECDERIDVLEKLRQWDSTEGLQTTDYHAGYKKALVDVISFLEGANQEWGGVPRPS